MAAAHGADVKIIGCTWLVVPHGIFVHDNITSMEQLRGKTIAISSPGAFPEIFAKRALDHFHIPENAVKYASLGGDLDRYRALVAGVADAAVVSGEYVPIAAEEAIKMLVSAEEALPLFVRMRRVFHRQDAGRTAAGRGEIPGRRNARPALRRHSQG